MFPPCLEIQYSPPDSSYFLQKLKSFYHQQQPQKRSNRLPMADKSVKAVRCRDSSLHNRPSKHLKAIDYKSLEQVAEALAKAGLETSNLIVGIDFSISNTWAGRDSFNNRSLHEIGGANNPYEQVLWLTGRTLAPYTKDKLIHCFGFGDASTEDHDVFSFRADKLPCNGILDVLARYRTITPNLKLAGPTSYVAIIDTAITIAGENAGEHHVLLIITDTQVTRDSGTKSSELSSYEKVTVNAISKAREYPLSIILVGVGDEPIPWRWSNSMIFKDLENSPLRAFENFKFVNFTGIMSEDVHLSRKEIEFSLAAFMGISQHRNTYKRNTGSCRKKVDFERVPLPPPVHVSELLVVSNSRLSEILRRAKTIHNESSYGPWFDPLEDESAINVISGYEGVIQIGNFPVPASYGKLYKKIWEKHGHLATRNVIQTSTLTLVTLVADLLKLVVAMKSEKVSASLMNKWDRQIEDAEALQFNVQWLRRHFKIVKQRWEVLQRQKAAALEKQSTACAKRDALKAQLLEAEKVVEQATSEINQNDCAITEDAYLSSLQKSFLEDAF